jgi:hypothetical protein
MMTPQAQQQLAQGLAQLLRSVLAAAVRFAQAIPFERLARLMCHSSNLT